MSQLNEVAPAFIEMAHAIVWCSAATVDEHDRPRSRVLHPIWEFDGTSLTGWIMTSPLSPKAAQIAAHPFLSATYWAPSQDTCTAECHADWTNDPASRVEAWDRFKNGPAPVGYDPAIIPPWTDPQVPAFGVLRLKPWRLRVMPGSVLMTGGKVGRTLSWSA